MSDDASDYNEEMQLFSTRSLVLLASSGCVALVVNGINVR